MFPVYCNDRSIVGAVLKLGALFLTVSRKLKKEKVGDVVRKASWQGASRLQQINKSQPLFHTVLSMKINNPLKHFRSSTPFIVCQCGLVTPFRGNFVFWQHRATCINCSWDAHNMSHAARVKYLSNSYSYAYVSSLTV